MVDFYAKISGALLFIASCMFLPSSCEKGTYDCFEPDGPSILSFSVTESSTKTAIDAAGIGTKWVDGDKINLWACTQDGTEQISGHPFFMLGHFGSEAVFSAQFANPMPEGRYTYYACYPTPLSSNGNTLNFSLPSEQDGRASGGADILIAEPAVSGELKSYSSEGGGLGLKMKHLVHILKFYLPSGSNGLNGEGIRRIRIEMPQAVTGILSADRTDPTAGAVLSDGNSIVSLDLDEPLTPSYGDVRKYAFASIFPISCNAGDKMKVTLYSDNWMAVVPEYLIGGRDFKPGHTTPVQLSVTSVEPYYTLNFKLSNNYLGEPVKKVTFSSDDPSVKFSDSGSQTYEWDPGRDLEIGETISFAYTNAANYLNLGEHSITVTYDSEHVRSTQTVDLPKLDTYRSYSVGLTVPYLLFEDFSGIASFSSNDQYSSGFLSGSKDAYSFLGGWTGGRCGAEAGKCVRIACRRETSVDYDARIDSAPLNGILKPNARLKVSFDYGANLKYSTITVLGIDIDNGATGQNCYVGYTDRASGFKSGSDSGTFDKENNVLNVQQSEKSGSYDYTPNHAEFILQNLPSGNEVIRIAWRTACEHRAGAHNCTNWLYVDNVKVEIANN